MALDTRLRILQTQRMIMTPMLQQAISLLQLSRLELLQEVRQQIEQNPVLEEGLEEIEEPQLTQEQEPPEPEQPEEATTAAGGGRSPAGFRLGELPTRRLRLPAAGPAGGDRAVRRRSAPDQAPLPHRPPALPAPPEHLGPRDSYGSGRCSWGTSTNPATSRSRSRRWPGCSRGRSGPAGGGAPAGAELRADRRRRAQPTGVSPAPSGRPARPPPAGAAAHQRPPPRSGAAVLGPAGGFPRGEPPRDPGGGGVDRLARAEAGPDVWDRGPPLHHPGRLHPEAGRRVHGAPERGGAAAPAHQPLLPDDPGRQGGERAGRAGVRGGADAVGPLADPQHRAAAADSVQGRLQPGEVPAGLSWRRGSRRSGR